MEGVHVKHIHISVKKIPPYLRLCLAWLTFSPSLPVLLCKSCKNSTNQYFEKQKKLSQERKIITGDKPYRYSIKCWQTSPPKELSALNVTTIANDDWLIGSYVQLTVECNVRKKITRICYFETENCTLTIFPLPLHREQVHSTVNIPFCMYICIHDKILKVRVVPLIQCKLSSKLQEQDRTRIQLMVSITVRLVKLLL